MLKVLLSSAGAKVPMLEAVRGASRRLAADAVVVAGDMDPDAVSQYVADEFWLMPATTDAHKDAILAQLIARGITHIIPSRDGELLFWAQWSSQLITHGITVLCASADAIGVCLDKLAFAATSRLVIPTYLDAEQVEAPLLVVKERYGAGSQSLQLKVTKAQATAHAKTLSQPIFQPFIAGREISIDAWLDSNYQVKGHSYRYREVVKQGESQITQTVSLPQFDSVIKSMLSALRLCGPVVLQAIIDQQHQLHIIECNSRFGGASTLGIKAGVDSMFWSLAQSLGHDLAAYPYYPSPCPIRQVRIARDLYL